VLPPDLDAGSAALLTRRAPIALVLGRQDEFATPELITAQEARLKQLGVAHETIRFDGGHEIDSDTLRSLADKSPG
jgi:predicted esterase